MFQLVAMHLFLKASTTLVAVSGLAMRTIFLEKIGLQVASKARAATVQPI